MQISPINSTSFGKLYISGDKNTKAAMTELITKKNTLKQANRILNELNEISGDRDVYLFAYKEDSKKGQGPQYRFSLNKGKPSWANVSDICRGEGHLGATLAHLKELCTKHYEEINSRVTQSELNDFFYNFSEEKEYKDTHKPAELSDDDAFLVPDNNPDECKKTHRHLSYADTDEPLDLLDIGVNPWA